MINLMYLVLTALLALNVSAEVMNAFISLDKGLKNTNAIVDTNNSQILANIQKQADAYKNEQNEKFRSKAIRTEKITKDFVDYVQGVWDDLFEAAGGPSEKDPSMPKRIKDKDVTTRMFVLGDDGDPTNQDAVGFELERRIRLTRDSFMAIVENDPAVMANIPLNVEEDWKNSKDKQNWADWKFRQMPVAAVFPLLTKIQADAKASSSAVLNYLFKKVTGEEIKFDAFEPVISAQKGYVIKGEKYQADVFLSAYSTSASGNTRILVNGGSLPVKEGKASYETVPTTLGTKQYNVEIQVTNPLTNEVKSYKKTFEYEVGERSVTVSAEKMNVFYIGVDNPLAVSAAGVSSNDLQVSINGGGGTLKRVGNSQFVVNVTEPTDDCRIVVNAPTAGLRDSKLFRVKRIPDPVARLGNKEDGSMGNGEFKAQQGVIAWLDNFDFDAKCLIQSFTIVRVPKREDPIEADNQGGGYNDKAARLVNMARPGDTYYFRDVKARCPGDKAGRKINSMVFQIR